MTTRDAVRTLAHPGFVLALVVLALNDHVLKQAYPGMVTGKLSDVAGLVVAPLLLAVPLTVVRVPRPMIVAIAATGVGFTLTKAFSTGAAITSDLWSLTSIPTQMRADVTDLLALPALYGAWLVHRHTAAAPRQHLRAVLATAIGVALLPVTVLATAATNCVPEEGTGTVVGVQGQFSGPPRSQEARILVSLPSWLFHISVDAEGEVSRLPKADYQRYDHHSGWPGHRTCDGADTCWRVGDREERRVDISHDSGKTWETDYVLSDDDAEAAVDGVHVGCGQDPSAVLFDVSVLGTGDDVVVVVSANHAGLLLRTQGEGWRVDTLEDIDDLTSPSRAAPPAEGHPHRRLAGPAAPG